MILRIASAAISENSIALLNTLREQAPQGLRPLLRPALERQAEVLGVSPEQLRKTAETTGPRSVREGEIFTDGTALFIVNVEERITGGRLSAILSRDDQRESEFRLGIDYFGPDLHAPRYLELCALAERIFGIEIQPSTYTSSKFDDLVGEDKSTATRPSEEEVAAATGLLEPSVKMLARAIKSSGGLLVRVPVQRLFPEEVARNSTLR